MSLATPQDRVSFSCSFAAQAVTVHRAPATTGPRFPDFMKAFTEIETNRTGFAIS